jgi:hypothetical protein
MARSPYKSGSRGLIKQKPLSPIPVTLEVYSQDPFILEVSKLISKTGTAGFQNSAQAQAARNFIQNRFSDFIEEVIFKQQKGEKQAKLGAAAPDLVTTEGDAVAFLGVKPRISQTEAIKSNAVRNIELKSTTGSGKGTTLTELAVGAISGEAGEKRDPREIARQVGEIEAYFRQKGGLGNIAKSGKQIVDSAGNFIPGSIGSVALRDLIINSNTTFAKNMRLQIQTKGQEIVTFELREDVLKGGKPTAKAYTGLTIEDYNFSIDSKTLSVQAKIAASGEKKVTDATLRFNAAPAEVNKKFIKEFLPRAIKAAQANGGKAYLTTLLALATAFAPGKTPYVVSLGSQINKNGVKIPFRVTAARQKRKQQGLQRFISGAQLTALVQRRLGETMPKGPFRGPPLSPNVLTERTGRFRRSIEVIPDYRRNIMNFYYDPIYLTFVDTERNPDRFVGQTIREITQELFARQFQLVRR